MMKQEAVTFESSRTELARALGFPDYPHDAAAEPYLNYLTNRCIGGDTMEAYIRLLIVVVRHFRVDTVDASVEKSIQGLLDVVSSSSAFTQRNREDVEDTVLYAIGTWTLLLSSFIHLPMAGGLRKVMAAYNLRIRGSPFASQPYGEDLAGLIVGSGLLPAPVQYLPSDPRATGSCLPHSVTSLPPSLNATLVPASIHGTEQPTSSYSDECIRRRSALGFLHDLDSLESLTINATRLNAYTLNVFGAVDIAWTHNVSRHLLLSKRDGRHILEIFSLPCALNATSLKLAGITTELAQEITETYSLLFNASHITPRHVKFGRFLGIRSICWCSFCSVRQYRNRAIAAYKTFSQHRTPGAKLASRAHSDEYDPLLVNLMSSEPSDWTPDMFPHLWTRIMILGEHLEGAKPWSVWVLFRDRRDTLQFWTFFFATIVVFLTSLQVLLGVAQVVGTFGY